MVGSKGPILAAVIPTLNEEEYIGECLNSLIRQSLDSTKYMIMVLDGGSSDNTTRIVSESIDRSKEIGGPKIVILDNPGRHVAEARNIALDSLPTSVTLMVELIGHCTVPENHLEKRLEVWNNLVNESDENIAALGVKVLPSTGQKNVVETWIESALSSKLGSGSGQFDNFSGISKTKVPAFCMHSRKAVESVDGWDTDFITSQDSDLSMRLIKEGYELYRTDATFVNMVKRSSFTSWLKMGYRYGFWRTKTNQKHKMRISKREFLPWFGFLITVGLIISGFQFWFVPLSMYSLVLLVEAINFSLKWRNISIIFGLPLCLISLHITFSLGLLMGYFRKGKASNDR